MKDRNRLRSLDHQRAWPPPNNILTAEEDAEEAHLTARVAAYDGSPEGKARSRISELFLRRIRSEAEQSELDELKKRYPDQPDPDDPLAPALEAVARVVKKQQEQYSQERSRKIPARPTA
jgi:hypothetical protein